MSRKWTVVEDELFIKGYGIYCIMPYERLDEHGRALFKIGMAEDFRTRLEIYHTYFPLSVWDVVFLVNPKKGKAPRQHLKTYLRAIEQEIMDDVIKNGGKLLYSTTRINNKGATEWISTDTDTVIDAFRGAFIKYGGEIHPFTMDHINDTAKINEKHKPNYHAELYYPLDTVPIDIKKPGKRVKGGGLGSSVDKSLTDLEILTLTDNMCKVVMYDKIHLYDDITQLFGDYDCIALLYQIKSKSYGHWVALILDREIR